MVEVCRNGAIYKSNVIVTKRAGGWRPNATFRKSSRREGKAGEAACTFR